MSASVEVDIVKSDAALPAQSDVVVIGGGIIGCATTLFLSECGIKAVLCEKGEIAGEQSSRNWGWCRTMGRDLRELPLMLESMNLWRGLSERVGAETGFNRCGALYICPTDKALAEREAWLAVAKEYGVDSRLLRGNDVNQRLEGLAKAYAGALYTPSDGVAEPTMAVPAVAKAARQLGASIMTGCAVTGLDFTGGRVSGVITEKGRIVCNRVVIAGGAWSSLLCRSLGLRLPQLKVLSSVFRTAPFDNGPLTAAWGPGLSLRKRLDGGYTVSHGSVIASVVPDSLRYLKEFLPILHLEWSNISLKFGQDFFDEWRRVRRWQTGGISPFEYMRVLDPSPDADNLRRARVNLEQAFPAFRTVDTVASWAGMVDATPDLMPVISEVETIPGLIISTGYSGHGFGIGLGAGQLTADLVSGNKPLVDPTPFRFSRFSDYTSLKPQVGL